MILAAIERTLNALIQATRLDERKLEQLQKALEAALGSVRNARFKVKQEQFKANSSF